VTPLAALTVSDSDNMTLVGAVTTGAQSYTSDAGTSLRGTFRTTNNDISFNTADVTLAGDTTISTGSGGGNIAFNVGVDITARPAAAKACRSMRARGVSRSRHSA